MSRSYFSFARRSTAFTWKITCRSGVLVFGRHPDFLPTIVIAKVEKSRWALLLPTSTLRVHLLYPNGQRVSKDDLKAAIRALANHGVESAVSARLSAAAGVPPAAKARTERTAAAEDGSYARSTAPAFRQAGVVAPPDSPDLGNLVVVAPVSACG